MKTPKSDTQANEPQSSSPVTGLQRVTPGTTVDQLQGLHAAGEVVGRRRSSFGGKDGSPLRYNISLALMAPTGKLVVDLWASVPAPDGLPRVGEHVCVPITLQHFTTKNGVGTRLLWGSSDRGEAF